MNLSPLQRKTLEQYSGFRNAPPSVSRLLTLASRNYMRLVIAIALGIILTIVVEIPSVAFVLVGMAVGAVSRDLGMFRKYVQVWPIVSQVLDWNHIDELLADHRGDHTAASRDRSGCRGYSSAN